MWEPILGGDHDRATGATHAINGPQVTHYWDPEAASGRWFADNMPWEQSGPAWDVFYLFDADATWESAPDPVLAWGFTIVGERDVLQAGLDQLLT